MQTTQPRLITTLCASLAALAAPLAAQTAPASGSPAPAAPADEVVLDKVEVTAGRSDDYTVRSTPAATRLDLSPRQTPQSLSTITLQRIEDQNLVTLDDIVRATTGLSSTVWDTERPIYYSRGFPVTNYQYDGVPVDVTYYNGTFGDSNRDTAVFERVDIVRGATGLLTGPGNPSASINLTRKHADSKTLTGSVTAAAGSWDNYRAVLDVSSPLSADGRVRGRFVGVYQDRDSHLDYYSLQKRIFYGVIDADLTAATTLSVGFDHQEVNPDGVTWGGLPLVFSDGTFTDWSRSKTTAPRWSFWDSTVRTAFVTLKHTFENDWSLTGTYTHTDRDAESALLYLFGSLDRTTGTGLFGGAGRYSTQTRLDSVDLYATGPFALFGREHELVAGFTARQTDSQADGNYLPVAIGNFYTWDGNVAMPAFGALLRQQDNELRETGTYAAARFNLADPLRLIAGARFSTWKNTAIADTYRYEEPTLYGGLVYDLSRTYSVYVSYTDIFQPQTAKDITNSVVDPIIGSNVEAGLKAEYLEKRLNVSAAVFRTKQDNLYVTDYTVVLPDGTNPVTATGPIDSKGVEAEISGQITPGWNVTLGAVHYTIEDDNGTDVVTGQPRTTVKLFTAYTLPGDLNKLTLGGGVSWQSKSYQDSPGQPRIQQDAFYLVDVFARYRFTRRLSAQVSVGNLFDEEYYTPFDSYNSGIYGTPRNFTLTVKYAF